jgi:cysteine desulfurase
VAQRDLDKNMATFEAVRDRLHAGLASELGPGTTRLNGHPQERLPNTLSLSFRGIEANVLLAQIGDEVAASAGAACHAGEVNVSAVLEAMKVPVEWAMGTVRFSVGRDTSPQEIDRVVRVVADAVRALKAGDTGHSIRIGPVSTEPDGQRLVES